MAASGKRLIGKSVFITGAAQGIGRASAVVSTNNITEQRTESLVCPPSRLAGMKEHM